MVSVVMFSYRAQPHTDTAVSHAYCAVGSLYRSTTEDGQVGDLKNTNTVHDHKTRDVSRMV